MIVDLLAGALLGAVTWLVGLLPDGGPLGLSSFSGIWTGYAFLNSFLPLTELLAAAGVMLAIQGAVFAYLALRQVRAWLPFI